MLHEGDVTNAIVVVYYGSSKEGIEGTSEKIADLEQALTRAKEIASTLKVLNTP